MRGVGCDAGHGFALGNTDGAGAGGARPFGELFAHAGGLDAPVGLGPGQLCVLFEQGSGIAIAQRSEQVADIDHVGHIGGGGVDHPAELFDTFDQFGQHVRFCSRRIERAERVDCGDGRDDRSSDRKVVSVTVSDRFVGVDGAEPCKRWHRTRERSHRRPPRIEILDSGQRCRLIRPIRRIRRAVVRR